MTKQLGKPPPRYCQRCDVRLSVKRKRMKFCYRCGVTARKEQSDRHHRARLAKTYGLLLDDYDAIYEYQRGKCAICQRATGATKRLSVDHDHRIGAVRDAVRGLLCSKCNGMLGHARDDPAVFERAAAYLRSPPAREVLK